MCARVDVVNALTSDEILVLQAIESGTFFVDWAAPTGVINGVNDDFTLASTPNPVTSFEVKLNGALLTITEDYTLVGSTLTMVTPPPTGSILGVKYRFEPL
jgi:hypothetical protein